VRHINKAGCTDVAKILSETIYFIGVDFAAGRRGGAGNDTLSL
jgi:hypothetical protein